ncbi:hypothetical protein [Aggregatilinea lenta]|uniref:hypothetical protein n=1 Tax=Aggregatilinea lenta TaxID=913108 RepID=UPI0013C2E555|nr:hypothetical protein [Aggregatilinea lenta]
MNRKTIAAAVVLSVVFGLWGLLYGLSQTLKPEPLRAQVYPERSLVQQPTSVLAANGVRYDQLVQQVAPLAGTTIAVVWGDMGQKLVAAGAIDLGKVEAHYSGLDEAQQAALVGDDLTAISFTPENIQFWTNVLWSLGLIQDSKVLSKGPMQQNVAWTPLGNYASTGGWTLGSQPATDLYGSARLVDLTPEQDDLVYGVAEHIFRPCCGNHAAFPDCNHGMAVLGLLELMASQGATEDELYQAALTFNAYAFSDTYITLAAYFAQQDIPWADVNVKEILGSGYSSGQAASRIAAAVGPIPGVPVQGGSCGA